MKTSINSKKITQSLLLMSILCMSLNIMAPDEELITNRETNSAELLEKRQAAEKATMDEAIEAARNESKESILQSRTAEIAGGQRTIERSLWEKIKDAFKPRSWNNAAAAEDFLKTQTNRIGKEDHSFSFTGDVLNAFRKLDTAQKTEVLQNSMEKACNDVRSELSSAKTDVTRKTVKDNFITKMTELKTAIEQGKDNGTGMLNPDQYLEILNSKGEVVSIQDLKELTNLGDITFRIRTDAQKTEETNKINLEQRRQKEKEAQAQKNTTMETNTKRIQAKLKNEALEKTKQMKSEKET